MPLSSLLELFRADSVDRIPTALHSISVDSKLPIEWDGRLGFLSYSPPLLSVAAFFSAEHCFKALLALNARTDSLDFFRTPVTHFAAAGGSIPILQLLLDRGMSFAGAGFPAIEHHRLSAVKFLLKNRLIRYGDVDPRGFSHLLVAIENDCFDIVQEFVSSYEFPFSTGSGYSPICLSLVQERMGMAEFLIGERTMDINQTDIDGVVLGVVIRHCILLV
jgi:hypothetical protein